MFNKVVPLPLEITAIRKSSHSTSPGVVPLPLEIIAMSLRQEMNSKPFNMSQRLNQCVTA